MPGADKKWDAAAERDLCVAIIMGNQETDRVRYNWARVHEFMTSHGYPFTKDAISQHFSKVIMKDFKARHGAASGASTPKTPKSTSGSSKRARKKVDPEEDTPTKKPKRAPSEEDDDDHVKQEEETPRRERSATLGDSDSAFDTWVNADSYED